MASLHCVDSPVSYGMFGRRYFKELQVLYLTSTEQPDLFSSLCQLQSDTRVLNFSRISFQWFPWKRCCRNQFQKIIKQDIFQHQGVSYENLDGLLPPSSSFITHTPHLHPYPREGTKHSPSPLPSTDEEARRSRLCSDDPRQLQKSVSCFHLAGTSHLRHLASIQENQLVGLQGISKAQNPSTKVLFSYSLKPTVYL